MVRWTGRLFTVQYKTYTLRCKRYENLQCNLLYDQINCRKSQKGGDHRQGPFICDSHGTTALSIRTCSSHVVAVVFRTTISTAGAKKLKKLVSGTYPKNLWKSGHFR